MSAAPQPISALAGKFLIAGIAGLAVTALGLLLSPAQHVALSYLVGVAYWVAIAVGMLLLIIIHHLTDAGWSTVIRRQYEHGVSAFVWLAVLFLPLLVSAWMQPGPPRGASACRLLQPRASRDAGVQNEAKPGEPWQTGLSG